MAITLYSASVPIFVRQLGRVGLWLDKAESLAEAKKFKPAVFMASRLAPDMLAFPSQIQIACDTAKFFVARVTGTEAPKFDDSESSFAELRERVQKTLDFVQSVPEAKFAGADERIVSVPIRGGTIDTPGETYLKNAVLPNFFFHLTTAYALLRMNGVEIGKTDFLGPMPKDEAAKP